MNRAMPKTVSPWVRKALRWYGMHGPDKGKYRLVNYLAPRLVPPDANPVTVKAPHGFRMSLDLREHIQQRAYYLGYHEHMVAHVFSHHVEPDTAVFDLGANFGQFTLLAAQLVSPKGQVFAFEPNPVAFAALQRNVELNSYDHVVCRPTAVSAERGTATFYTSPPSDLGTSSLAQMAVQQYHEDVGAITVDVERLDDYLDQAAERVSLIKMDIQGAELPALQGAERLISRDHPTLVLEVDEEVTRAFGYKPRELGSYLNYLGYTLYSVPVRPWQRPHSLDWRELASHDIYCLHESSRR